jgi:hypothetical protein
LIADAINRMVEDGVLKPIRGLQSVVFRLQPGLKVKDPMADKENRPGGRSCVRAVEEVDGSTPDDQLQREKTDAMSEYLQLLGAYEFNC